MAVTSGSPGLASSVDVTSSFPWETVWLEFERACQSPPGAVLQDIQHWVARVSPEHRADMLFDCVATHLDASWEAGHQIKIEDYVREFGHLYPEFESLAVVSVDLIEREFVARHRVPMGDHPELGEYASRFSGRDDVQVRLQHRCLGGDRYIAIQRRGQGGLGTVWVAYDRHLRRRVAVKEVNLAVADDPTITRRLASEARVTAGLEHPAIVTVHEMIDSDFEPSFYVMRLVEGQTLRQAVHDYHTTHKNSDSGQRLLWNALLQAFVTTCNAVEFSHSRGVIHRDLKPDNVMVGQFGEVVVIDWGLAEVVSQPPATRTDKQPPNRWSPDNAATPADECLGTPEYMAPEQLTGRCDKSTDIFLLGACLYEIITGHAPFQLLPGETRTEQREIIRLGQFRRPRQWDHGIPRTLEAVCLKAMSANPAHRYATARDLGLDISRILADEPVTICNPWRERFWRSMRRHRRVIRALTPVVLVSWILVTWQWFQAHKEWDRAELNFKYARGAIDKITRVALKDLAEIPRVDNVRRGFLEEALHFYERFSTENSSDVEVLREAALAARRVGDINTDLGSYDAAKASYLRALELQERLIAAYPGEPNFRSEWAATQNNLGGMLSEAGSLKDAEAAIQRAAQTYKELNDHFPDDFGFQVEYARSCRCLAHLLSDLGRKEDAVQSSAKAIGVWDRLETEFTETPGLLREVREEAAAAWGAHAANLFNAGQADAAEKLFRQTLRRYSDLEKMGPLSASALRGRGLVCQNLALLLHNARRYGEAQPIYDEACAIRQQLVDAFPARHEYRRILARSYADFAALLRTTGQFNGAVQVLRKAIPLFEQLKTDLPAMQASDEELRAKCETDLGYSLLTTSQFEEAETLLRRCIDFYERRVSQLPESPNLLSALAESHVRMNEVLANTKRTTEAIVHYQRALELYDTLVASSPKNPQFQIERASAHRQWGILLLASGQQEEGEHELLQAVQLGESARRDFPEDITCCENLGKSYNTLGNQLRRKLKYQEAEQALRRAVELRERLASQSPDAGVYQSQLGASLSNLAIVLRDRGELGSARQIVEQAIGFQSAALKISPRHADYRQFLRNHYQVLTETLIRMRDHEAASKSAVVQVELYRDDANYYYFAASLLARCATTAEADERLTEDMRSQTVDLYLDRAIDLLRRALDRGFDHVNSLRNDPTLDSLRGRGDFRRLMQQFDAKDKP